MAKTQDTGSAGEIRAEIAATRDRMRQASDRMRQERQMKAEMKAEIEKYIAVGTTPEGRNTLRQAIQNDVTDAAEILPLLIAYRSNPDYWPSGKPDLYKDHPWVFAREMLVTIAENHPLMMLEYIKKTPGCIENLIPDYDKKILANPKDWKQCRTELKDRLTLLLQTSGLPAADLAPLHIEMKTVLPVGNAPSDLDIPIDPIPPVEAAATAPSDERAANPSPVLPDRSPESKNLFSLMAARRALLGNADGTERLATIERAIIKTVKAKPDLRSVIIQEIKESGGDATYLREALGISPDEIANAVVAIPLIPAVEGSDSAILTGNREAVPESARKLDENTRDDARIILERRYLQLTSDNSADKRKMAEAVITRIVTKHPDLAGEVLQRLDNDRSGSEALREFLQAQLRPAPAVSSPAPAPVVPAPGPTTSVQRDGRTNFAPGLPTMGSVLGH